MVPDSDRMDPAITSSDYISDNFQPDDRLALVIKNQKNSQLSQYIVSAERMAMRGYQAWLRFEDSQGSDIYVGMNPLKSSSRRRTKDDIALVRHLYLDLDHQGLQSLEAICDDTRIPNPSYVLNTSQDKYQVVWKIIGHDVGKAEQLQRAMAWEYGADRAATDITRVLRIPGFHNHKYDPPYKVTAERLSFLTYTFSDFQIGLQPEPAADAQKEEERYRAPQIRGLVSQSERDWAETLQRLEHGEDPVAVQSWLEQKRQDKCKPAYYAALTVRKAIAEMEHRRAAGLAMDLS
jgi:hypothetical protein